MSFWNTLNKPIMALAPMADVTDAAFRQIIAKYGKPDVIFTEFTSVAGLCSPGREKLLVDFWYTESERPIVAQIFGNNPAQFYEVAKLIKKRGFDGIDINMGCPDRSVEKQGGGAALIKNPNLAQEIIKETKRGAGKLPVSVKTRLGYIKIDLDWIRALLEAKPAALIVHMRTRKEMSKVPAYWDAMADIVALRNKMFTTSKKRPLILGNGDVQTIAEAYEKVARYGCDGVMIGRGIFGNPWLFKTSGKKGYISSAPSHCPQISLEEKLRVMLEHTYVFEKLFIDTELTNLDAVQGAAEERSKAYLSGTVSSTRGGNKEMRRMGKFHGIKNFDIMKKHYKAYVSGFDGAKELRIKLMRCKNADDVARVLASVSFS